MVFAPPWLTPKGNFSEMFLVLLGRKSDGNEGYVGRVFKDFVFYCIYGRVQAILTYRVYQLYDISIYVLQQLWSVLLLVAVGISKFSSHHSTFHFICCFLVVI